MNANGTFEITMSAAPPYDVVEGVSLGRVSNDKRHRTRLSPGGRSDVGAARPWVDGVKHEEPPPVVSAGVAPHTMSPSGTWVMLPHSPGSTTRPT
jgi:hypothetical protein